MVTKAEKKPVDASTEPAKGGAAGAESAGGEQPEAAAKAERGQPQQSFSREELTAILDAQDKKWSDRLAESERKADRKYGRVKQALDGSDVLKDLDDDQRAAYLDRAETAKEHIDVLVDRHSLSDRQRAILSRARDRAERNDWAETMAESRPAAKAKIDDIDSRLEELGLKTKGGEGAAGEQTGLFTEGARAPRSSDQDLVNRLARGDYLSPDKMLAAKKAMDNGVYPIRPGAGAVR